MLGAVPRPAPLIVYTSPAGIRPAGADPVHPTDSVLPNGRIAAPAGKTVFVGTNPLGMALTPDGRFAIVSNDDQRTGGLALPNSATPLQIGYSLAVVDTKTMNVVNVYHDPSAAFFLGVAAVRDPSDPSRTIVLASDGGGGVVRVFDLDASGQLTPEQQTIALPARQGWRPYPAGIATTPDGRIAYVADNFDGALTAIDVARRTAIRTVAVGNFPLYVGAGAGHVLVTAGGLMGYAAVAPAKLPTFAAPSFDPQQSSVLSVLDLAENGDVAGQQTVPMDPQPDGTTDIGGAVPGSIVVTRSGTQAYVALANVDRVAVVSLEGQPRVVRGLDLRLYPNAPYGAAPSGQALSPDGKRLYVALAGLDAVAVLDARAPTKYRYGLIPTGWYPSAVELSSNGRFLYILDAKGVDGWGMLQRVDLKHTSLVKTTLAALRYLRTPGVAKFDAVVPPLRSDKRSATIDRIVYIAVGTATYDAMLGDLKDSAGDPHGNGEPSLCTYPESVTPNLHALARQYALADNFYAADSSLDAAVEAATAGETPLYTQLTARVSASRAPLQGFGNDPENYGRPGYVFNAMARAGLTYRDYGGVMQLSGYDGGLYHLDVPGLAALYGNVDPNYAGWNPKIDDAHRAQEFVADMGRYVDADQAPAFAFVWLPTGPRAGAVGDADRALGTIVDYLSHTPHWSSTAVFVVPEGVADGTDHVNGQRSYALVVSPLARRGYVGKAHLSVAGVVKTEEEILGLPALTLDDLLATDLGDFFVDAPQPEPYQAIR